MVFNFNGCYKIKMDNDLSTPKYFPYHLKKFVQESNNEKFIEESKNNLKRNSSVSGNDVKNSYLEIVGKDSLLCSETKYKKHNRKPKVLNKKCHTVPVSINKSVNDIMRLVEKNDVHKISEFLDIDKDYILNIKDQFGWTALMSACCAGSADIVRLLLKFNPDLSICDKSGNTCITLAKLHSHKIIISMLNIYLNSVKDNSERNIKIKEHVGNAKQSSQRSQKEIKQSFYCDICKENISQMKELHVTSTVHLFNCNKKSSVPTAYGIPDNNVGFQLLLKTGWNRNTGLGPDGSGHKFPPKTILKQDRTGLGAKKYTARVTHSQNNLDVKERIERVKTLNKKERLRNEVKSKQKERELRRALV